MSKRTHLLVVFDDGETWDKLECVRILEVNDAELEQIETHGEKIRHIIDLDKRGVKLDYVP